MNILFLTIVEFDSIYQSGIYQDLLREFLNNGHKIYIVSPLEKKIWQENRNKKCK